MAVYPSSSEGCQLLVMCELPLLLGGWGVVAEM
jgi:hypothetical protein